MRCVLCAKDLHGQPASRPDGRTDIVKLTQKVILSRTVYLKVGVRTFFLYVTISAQIKIQNKKKLLLIFSISSCFTFFPIYLLFLFAFSIDLSK